MSGTRFHWLIWPRTKRFHCLDPCTAQGWRLLRKVFSKSYGCQQSLSLMIPNHITLHTHRVELRSVTDVIMNHPSNFEDCWIPTVKPLHNTGVDLKSKHPPKVLLKKTKLQYFSHWKPIDNLGTFMHFLTHQIDIIHLVPGKQSTGRLRGWTEPVAIQWELISLVIGFFQWELISKYPWLCMVFLCSREFQFVTNSNFTCFDWNRSIFFGQGEFTQCCGTWISCLWFWSVKIHWISSNWGYSKLSFSGIVGVISCHISSNNWGKPPRNESRFFRGLAAAVFASFRHESGASWWHVWK